VGVVQALSELGVPVDYIGGASMGAGIAACWACGMDVPEIYTALRKVFVDSGVLRVPQLPVVAIFPSDRIEAALDEVMEGRYIEDLWLPFFAVSSNLTRMALEVHDRGLVWRALRASASIPAVLTPLFEKGELLVDGGFMDNLPVNAMRERCSGYVVACDVFPVERLEVPRDLEKSPSALSVLMDRLRRPATSPLLSFLGRSYAPTTPPLPTIAEILVYTMLCGNERERLDAFSGADVVLRPDTKGIPILHLRTDLAAAAKRGHAAAMQARESLLRLAHPAQGAHGSTDPR
jgi:predicted acylesterase/phospholipase RssA